MRRSDLYGFAAPDIESASKEIERALGLRLQPRDSTYVGEYYHWQDEDSELILQWNVDPLYVPGSAPPDEQFAEPRFSGFPVLLYVDVPERLDDIRLELAKQAPGIEHLERTHLTGQTAPQSDSKDAGHS